MLYKYIKSTISKNNGAISIIITKNVKIILTSKKGIARLALKSGCIIKRTDIMIIKSKVCQIRIDVDKTRSYYCSHPAEFCDCLYCKNYIKALPIYSPKLIGLLESMGIDYKTEGEAMHLNKNDDGTHSYLAFYHVVGEIIEGDGVINDSEDKLAFSTTSSCDLLPEEFPRPAIQINLSFNLDWVLDD